MLTLTTTIASNLSIYAILSAMIKDGFSLPILKKLVFDRYKNLGAICKSQSVNHLYLEWKRICELQEEAIQKQDYEQASKLRNQRVSFLSKISSFITASQTELPICTSAVGDPSWHFFENTLQIFFD